MAFFEIAPMGGMSVGSYPIGGARKGETLSEEQKKGMRMGRISSQEALLIRMAQQYSNASPELNSIQSRSKKMTPEQKLECFSKIARP